MMQFRTPVTLPVSAPRLAPTSVAVTVGSCFAEGVGRCLTDSLACGAAVTNPFGVVYNPLSAARCVELLLDVRADEEVLTPDDFVRVADGTWRSLDMAGCVSGESLAACRAEAARRRAEGGEVLRRADLLVVTFGTSRAYFRTDGAGERLVANCHKLPAACFSERTIDVPEIVVRWSSLLDRLSRELPRLHVVLTVSPYRYLKYGLHESALAKARLLLAVDSLCRDRVAVHYFPAYEIVTDELRDYRFYAADMVHPSPVAVDYVCSRFAEWAFTPDLVRMAEDKAALLRDFAHRPLHPASAEAEAFCRRREQRRREAEERWGQPLLPPDL